MEHSEHQQDHEQQRGDAREAQLIEPPGVEIVQALPTPERRQRDQEA
jgi:hypothetical protein